MYKKIKKRRERGDLAFYGHLKRVNSERFAYKILTPQRDMKSSYPLAETGVHWPKWRTDKSSRYS